jgi:hypothetical protein
MTIDPPVVMVPFIPELRDKLCEAAKEDDHRVVAPSHIFIKDEEIVGYCRVDVTCQWWLHSDKCNVRDTLAASYQMEAVMRDRGINNYVMLCAERSPYKVLMEKFGFNRTGTTVLFERKL